MKPGRSAAGRNSLKVDVDGSSPSPATSLTRASFNGSGSPATNRETGGSNPPARTISGPSSNGEGAALRRLRFRFDPGRAVQFRSVDRLARCPAVDRKQTSSILVRSAKVRGDVDKLDKSPALQAGHRGFESRHRYHWPEAHEDEQAILNRQVASSILAGPTRCCRVAELVQRSIVNREDVGSSPTPTASPAV